MIFSRKFFLTILPEYLKEFFRHFWFNSLGFRFKSQFVIIDDDENNGSNFDDNHKSKLPDGHHFA